MYLCHLYMYVYHLQIRMPCIQMRIVYVFVSFTYHKYIVICIYVIYICFHVIYRYACHACLGYLYTIHIGFSCIAARECDIHTCDSVPSIHMKIERRCTWQYIYIPFSHISTFISHFHIYLYPIFVCIYKMERRRVNVIVMQIRVKMCFGYM